MGTGEEDRGTCELGRFAESVHGRVTEDGGGARGWRSVLVKKQAAILVGWKKAGRDGVDADAAGSPFAGEKLSEAEDGGLGSRVGDDAGQRDVRGNAGDVDDAAFFGGEHSGSENLAWKKRATDKVQIEIRGPICGGDGSEGVVWRDGDFRIVAAGGVDENRGRAESEDGGVEECRETVPRAGVRFEENGAPALLGNGVDAGPAPLGVASADGDLGPRLGKPGSKGAAKRASGTDDDGDFLREVEER